MGHNQPSLKNSPPALPCAPNSCEHLYRAVCEASFDAILICDTATFQVYDYNNAAVKLYGYTSEEWRQMKVQEIAAETRLMETALRNAISKQEMCVPIMYHRKKHGMMFPAVTQCSLFSADADGRIMLCLVIRDSTVRRQLENLIRQSETMEAIALLARGVAHDFNNIIGAVSGYADMINNAFGRDNPLLTKYAQKINTAAIRASDMTARLLHFARKGSFKIVEFNFHELIDETIETVNTVVGKKISVKRRLKATHPCVKGDPVHLKHVILDLANNAKDAMPEGGNMIFETECVSVSADYIAAHSHQISPGHFFVFSLRDTGIGMDEETKARVFEPFYTTKEHGAGTGLSLASVYGIVRSHHGAIEVLSHRGKGTTFKIYLPTADNQPLKK